MGDIGNKEILAKNLRALMERFGKDRNQVCTDLSFKYTTFADWYNGNKYPRIDKIELLANYFGVQKSDLIEDKGGMFSIDSPSLPSNIIPMPHMNQVPLLGTIACGVPILAEENIEEYVDLPEHIKADFALRCKGESMINAGIRDGDIVYIRKQKQVYNGQIAAVRVGDDEATLKRFYFEDGVVQLVPENSSMHPKAYTGDAINQLEVIGLAVGYTHALEEKLIEK